MPEESNVVCVNPALIRLAWSPTIPESVQSHQEIFYYKGLCGLQRLGGRGVGFEPRDLEREET